jgi:hypothetical protein
LPNGLGCERGGELSHSCRGFKALDFLVLFDQAKRTLIDVTVGRGFKALDLLVLFHQVWYIPTASVGGTSRHVGGKRTTMLPIKWEVDARVAGKENE